MSDGYIKNGEYVRTSGLAKGGGGAEMQEITEAEYEALPATKLTDNVPRVIKDIGTNGIKIENYLDDVVANAKLDTVAGTYAVKELAEDVSEISETTIIDTLPTEYMLGQRHVYTSTDITIDGGMIPNFTLGTILSIGGHGTFEGTNVLTGQQYKAYKNDGVWHFCETIEKYENVNIIKNTTNFTGEIKCVQCGKIVNVTLELTPATSVSIAHNLQIATELPIPATNGLYVGLPTANGSYSAYISGTGNFALYYPAYTTKARIDCCFSYICK